MVFEVITYGGADILSMVFKALADIFGGGTLISLAKVAAIIGFTIMLMKGAMSRNIDMSQLLIVIIVVGFLMAPKATVKIKDMTATGFVNISGISRTVKRVPYGVAIPAAIMTQGGHLLVSLVESSFYRNSASILGVNAPDTLSYRKSGVMFAHSIVQESLESKVRDPRVTENLQSFFRQCIFYDIALGRYTIKELIEQNNVVDFIGKKTSLARTFTYTDPNTQNGAKRDLIQCRQGFNEKLFPNLHSERAVQDKSLVNNILHYMGYAGLTYKGESTVGTGREETISRRDLINRNLGTISGFIGNEQPDPSYMGNGSSALAISAGILSGVTRQAGASNMQAMMANALRSGIRNVATESDAQSLVQSIAITSAERDRRMSMVAAGEMAKKYIPRMKNIIEYLLYACAPIVFIMSMTGNGLMVIGSYFKMLLWINLWPTLFAILNFYMLWHTSGTLSESSWGQNGAWSIAFIGVAQDTLREHAAIGGYLMMSIPVISWMLVQYGSTSLASVAAGVTGGLERSAATTIAAANQGNMNMMNQSYGNETAWQRSLAPQTREGHAVYEGANGVSQKMTASGNFLTNSKNNTGLSSSASASQLRELGMGVQRTQSAMEKAGENWQSSTLEAAGAMIQASKRATKSEGIDKTERNAISIGAQKIEQLSAAVKEESSKQAQTHTAWNAGVKVGFGGSSGAFSGGFSAGAEKGGRTTDSDTSSATNTATNTKALQEAVENQRALLESVGVRNSTETGESLTTQEQQSLTKAQNAGREFASATQAFENASNKYAETLNNNFTGGGALLKKFIESGGDVSQLDNLTQEEVMDVLNGGKPQGFDDRMVGLRGEAAAIKTDVNGQINEGSNEAQKPPNHTRVVNAATEANVEIKDEMKSLQNPPTPEAIPDVKNQRGAGSFPAAPRQTPPKPDDSD